MKATINRFSVMIATAIVAALPLAVSAEAPYPELGTEAAEQQGNCVGDLDADGQVGVEDILILLAEWSEDEDVFGSVADLNGDRRVDDIDLEILHANWGSCSYEASGCPGDVNGDGEVDVNDVLIILAQFDSSGQFAPLPADVNDDGYVDDIDLDIVMGSYGPCPPELGTARAGAFVDPSFDYSAQDIRRSDAECLSVRCMGDEADLGTSRHRAATDPTFDYEEGGVEDSAQCVATTLYADIVQDGTVDTIDLLELLSQWGECGLITSCEADITGDGVVDEQDLDILMSEFGCSLQRSMSRHEGGVELGAGAEQPELGQADNSAKPPEMRRIFGQTSDHRPRSRRR